LTIGPRASFALGVDPIRFAGAIRHWNPEKASGLVVIDIPPELVPSIGGLKQQRVRGVIGGAPSSPRTSCRPAAAGSR
jgi:hypothetical protein